MITGEEGYCLHDRDASAVVRVCGCLMRQKVSLEVGKGLVMSGLAWLTALIDTRSLRHKNKGELIDGVRYLSLAIIVCIVIVGLTANMSGLGSVGTQERFPKGTISGGTWHCLRGDAGANLDKTLQT
ncbi:uncharacterized protein BO80DRAFT_132896 [Aspergillus ibericus CBS 121593]|uniref:Uncharacterized protein n=1 Tax=Aspergillus ibericus CBS 121593 TaxID=1448316 RepID=A0A395HC37_9EURO|nr:hypothetical protein BO80DRAFT_132896 [Aspergillus ibericus CBS 121593]RAL05270.1 hypothetical protein BO80DRAFT_132896 [Aspergillus ibericus CBS 121593]